MENLKVAIAFEQPEEVRSLIHSLPTSPATLATPQSAAVIAGCVRTLENEEKRSHKRRITSPNSYSRVS
jgi:hypothetical protein